MVAKLVCVDCEKEGVSLTRKASRPGPLCVTHRRARKKKSSDARYEAHILKTYGLTIQEYWQLYEAQGRRCAICQVATGRTRRLSVDHYHKTGEVRGLLCRPCNTLLGRARDAIEFFQRAIDYLNNPPARSILKKRGNT